MLRPDGLLAVAYISRLAVFPHVVLRDKRFLRSGFGENLLETGVIRAGEEDCFWTDCYFALPEEMESLLAENGLAVVDHIAADGVTPLLAEQVNALTTEQLAVWCDYHYRVCREKSLLGQSNHGLILGRKEKTRRS